MKIYNFMKTFFSLLFLIFTVQLCHSQTSKVYYSFQDFFDKKGEGIPELTIKKRTNAKIAMIGGADYQPYTTDKTLNKEIKKEIVLIEKSDSLYINCMHIKYRKAKMGQWYAPAIEIDKKIYFSAMPIGNSDAIATGTVLFGAIGGGIAAASVTSKRIYYCIDPETTEIEIIKEENMLQLLGCNETIKAAYEKEEDPNDIDTIRKYLYLIKSDKAGIQKKSN